MITANVFRAIPPTDPMLLSGIEEPNLTDVAWPHLSLVYGILLKYQQANLVNNPLGHEFFVKLLGNLAAPDRNERELVLTYVKRHVAANRRDLEMAFVKFSNVLKAYRCGWIEPYPVTPILKFFANHWRDHRLVRERVVGDLFDLVASRHMKTLLGPITQLFDVAIENDRKLGTQLIQKCLMMWPKAYPSKQLVYFDLVVFLIERISHNRLEQMIPSLCDLFTRCAMSLHRDLIRRSFKIWNDSRFVATILDLTPRMFPLVLDAIMTVAREHWNTDVRKDANKTLAAMRKLDQFTFDAQDHRFRKAVRASDPGGAETAAAPSAADGKKLKRQRSWMTIIRYAGKHHRGLNVPRTMAIIQRGLNEQ
jgi:serine/threonine-protein phosphatase 2A regulatory subunit B'